MTKAQSEYNKLYRSLKRSVEGYKKKGYDVSFFNLPEKPTKATKGSINKLKSAINEWHYYTGRGKVDASKLPARISKTGTEAYKNLGSKVGKSINRKMQQAAAGQALIDAEKQYEANLAELNRDNPYYMQAMAEGYNLTALPSASDNLALKIYEMAEEALYVDPKSAVNGNQQALFSVTEKKAELAIMRFDHVGVTDPSYNVVYNLNLADGSVNFSDIEAEFMGWLYASDQYNDIDTTPLEHVIDIMTKYNKNVSYNLKQMGAEAAEAYEKFYR